MASLAHGIERRIQEILRAPESNFVELADLAGFDPTNDFRYMRVRDVDFDGCDLAGFDFTGSYFKDCSFVGARIAGATFDDAHFDRSDLKMAEDWARLNRPATPEGTSAFRRRVSARDLVRAPLPVSPGTDVGVGMTQAPAAMPTRAEFAALLADTLGGGEEFEGLVVKGTVTAIENDMVVIDVGLKSEGRVALREFSHPGEKAELKPGDEVEVYVDRVENGNGEAILSRDRARREAAWDRLEAAFPENDLVMGVIFGRVKGGFTVDLDGLVAFLPGSQVDVRPIRDITPLIDIPLPFRILKMDRRRGNVVVSRRAILEATRAEERIGLIQTLVEGQIVEATVKNITDYGAFVDLGGIDGLLHVTDLSHKRIYHPSEMINVDDVVRVQILRINRDTQRISVGMKQLEVDPWDRAPSRYPIGAQVSGCVTNITEYGAFVELEPGIEGLVHVSEMSWTKKNVHPGNLVSTSQLVDVVVLEVDIERHRISLSLKQVEPNPWKDFAKTHPVGSMVEGEVAFVTELGLFVRLDNDLDGLIHMLDISWDVSGSEALNLHRKGEHVRALVLAVDVERERISLGLKQRERRSNTAGPSVGRLEKLQIVTVTVLAVHHNGLEVQAGEDGLEGFIERSELDLDRDKQRPDRFRKGQKFDAMVVGFERLKKNKFSISALQRVEGVRTLNEFTSPATGATLGDILGEALRAARQDRE